MMPDITSTFSSWTLLSVFSPLHLTLLLVCTLVGNPCKFTLALATNPSVIFMTRQIELQIQLCMNFCVHFISTCPPFYRSDKCRMQFACAHVINSLITKHSDNLIYPLPHVVTWYWGPLGYIGLGLNMAYNATVLKEFCKCGILPCVHHSTVWPKEMRICRGDLDHCMALVFSDY